MSWLGGVNPSSGYTDRNREIDLHPGWLRRITLTNPAQTHSKFRQEIQHIKTFAFTVDKYLESAARSSLSKLSKLPTQDKKTVNEFLNAMKDWEHSDGKKNEEAVSLFERLPVTAVQALLDSESMTKYKEAFLPEMTLIYLVTFQEAFIQQYLRDVLFLMPSLLKSEKRLELTYEEAFRFQSIDSVRAFFVDRQVDDVPCAKESMEYQTTLRSVLVSRFRKSSETGTQLGRQATEGIS